MYPYERGYAARECGETLRANPYPVGSNDYIEWLDGYIDASNNIAYGEG